MEITQTNRQVLSDTADAILQLHTFAGEPSPDIDGIKAALKAQLGVLGVPVGSASEEINAITTMEDLRAATNIWYERSFRAWEETKKR